MSGLADSAADAGGAQAHQFPQDWLVPTTAAGARLDIFLAQMLPRFSRAHLQRAIRTGMVLVNGRAERPSFKLHDHDRVHVEHLEVARQGPEPQPLPLDIVYEDASIAVVNKAAGMIVHPARGHWDGTLASALAHHFTQLSGRGGPTRPGIVHRLDRETSGVIVVAKSDPAHDALAEQFKSRTVAKEYLAIVVGVPDRDRDVVDQPIGNHPTQREKMAIRVGHNTSRDATTFYEIQERFAGFALVRAVPKTGRTHQIRLHLAHAGCPVLCDRLYGGRTHITAAELRPDRTSDRHIVIKRHALHAHRLTIVHPVTSETLCFEAPLPGDMTGVLEVLRG